MGLLVPDDKQHRAFQQKAFGVRRLTQPEEQPLDPVAQEEKVEVLPAAGGFVLQASLDGRGQVFGATLM